MLSELADIHYKHPDKMPVIIKINGNHLTLDICVRYNRRALRLLPGDSRTAADVIESGIRQAWGGYYRIELPGLPKTADSQFLYTDGQPGLPVYVSVVFHRDWRRRPVLISLRRLVLMPAHVISPFWRRIWGVFKTGQLESLGTNWSLTQPGQVILPSHLPAAALGRVAAHEAGHFFGLGDAYGAIYRFYCDVPGKETYMMYSNQKVSAEEISMLIQAHQTGRMQFFPKSWDTRRFLKGLRQDVSTRTRQLERWLDRRKKP